MNPNIAATSNSMSTVTNKYKIIRISGLLILKNFTFSLLQIWAVTEVVFIPIPRESAPKAKWTLVRTTGRVIKRLRDEGLHYVRSIQKHLWTGQCLMNPIEKDLRGSSGVRLNRPRLLISPQSDFITES